jgi:hypothetical protein
MWISDHQLEHLTILCVANCNKTGLPAMLASGIINFCFWY